MRSGKDHIYIVGSGAIGRALAVFLSVSGRKVTLVRGSVNDGSKETQCFRVQMQNGHILEADIEITSLNILPVVKGVVVLANKSYGNERLAALLKEKIGDSPLVLLQNGLGIEQPYLDNDFAEIYRCVLFVTSQTIDEATVRFKSAAACPIGIERGNIDHLDKVVQQLDTPYFMFKREASIRNVVWKKVILNCIFNTVCPLLEVDNGIFHRNNEALHIAKRIISECLAVANAKEICLTQAEIEESLSQISKASDGQLISTLQDIRSGRRTEIDTLNFEIVRLAEALEKSELVRETKLLGELVKLKSEFNMQVQTIN